MTSSHLKHESGLLPLFSQRLQHVGLHVHPDTAMVRHRMNKDRREHRPVEFQMGHNVGIETVEFLRKMEGETVSEKRESVGG